MNTSSPSTLAAIIDALPFPAALIDSAGQLVCLSATCRELLGGQETDQPISITGEASLDTWFRDAVASIAVPESGSLVTYLQSPFDRQFTITWSNALPEGHILQITESTHQGHIPAQVRQRPLNAVHGDALEGTLQLPTQIDLSLRIQTLIENQNTKDTELTLYCLGLTGLRSLNDSYGYRTIDKLLMLLHTRLADSTINHPSNIDMIARLSSGELMLLTQTPSGTAQVGPESKTDWQSVLADHLQDLAERPYIIEQRVLMVGACIGVAQLTPEQHPEQHLEQLQPTSGADLSQELLRQSIVARHGLMQAGNSGWQLFNESMDRAMKQRLELENDLRRAIALDEFELYFQPKLQLGTDRIMGFEALIRWHHPTRGMVPPIQRLELENDLRRAIALDEFELYFQPKLQLGTDRIMGFEALIRWHHPTRGMVPPIEFIPAAEELGLIVPMGEWIIQEACRCARDWPSDQTIAINISVVQFTQDNFAESIIQAIKSNGIAAEQVELEITESVLLGNEDDILKTLHVLKEQGVRIAMDDFGTGYSSMSYLRQFPFDTLKIDQSFVRDPANEKQNAIIRSAIFSLGKKFGMSVVAEGVETKEQLEQMESEHCDLVQGYLISKPVPFAKTFDLLQAYNDKNILVPAQLLSAEEAELAVIPRAKNQGEANLLRLVYLSTNQMSNNPDAFEDAISQIMSSSIHNNANVKISGALMFNANVFAQVLEGSPEDVEATFERIQRDERHANVTVLDCARTDTRQFPNWAMAFIGETEDNSNDFREIASLTDFSDKPLQGDRILTTLLNLVRNKSGEFKKAA